ncbi:VCBS repeat-containing protein [Streptomyces sp. BG9H]|uniref:VCBS repeat-containing protein n=1 Tax=Streptomyces anatolicus TaxID=2675858 RepID=A0ABS6YQ43_9ACTN|nr:VCBS repeat-containing protein [Streptomyces anatolicus]
MTARFPPTPPGCSVPEGSRWTAPAARTSSITSLAGSGRSAEQHPRFLVATTGGEAVDIVGFGPQGVVVSRGRRDGTFEPSELVLNDYGNAQGWGSKKHLRLLADITGDGRLDIVGFGGPGVYVARNLHRQFETR